MSINTQPIVDGSSFATIRANINNNFTEIDQSIEEISKNIVVGTYTGDGAEERQINLGFEPAAVEIYTLDKLSVVLSEEHELPLGTQESDNYYVGDGYSIKTAKRSERFHSITKTVYGGVLLGEDSITSCIYPNSRMYNPRTNDDVKITSKIIGINNTGFSVYCKHSEQYGLGSAYSSSSSAYDAEVYTAIVKAYTNKQDQVYYFRAYRDALIKEY